MNKKRFTAILGAQSWRSFRTQLMLAVIAVIFVTVAVVGGSMYKSSSDMLKQDIELNVNQQLELNAQLISQWRDRVTAEMNGITGLPAFVNGNSFDERVGVLQGFLSRNSDFLRFSLFDTKGQGQQIEKKAIGTKFDISSRDYYQTALTGKTLISEPMISKADNSMIMNATAPIRDANGTVTGVITGAIGREQIAAIVQRIQFGETGYAYMVNDKGDILAHPDASKVLTENILETAETPEQKASYEQFLQMQEPYIGYIVEGKAKHLVGVRQIPDSVWKLVVTAPYSEFTESLDKMWLRTLLISFIIMIVGIAFALWLGQTMSQGIIKVGQAMNQLAQGDLKQHLQVRSRNEVGQLATDFNTMTANLRTLIGQVSLNSEQLAATFEELSASADQNSVASQHIAQSIQKVAEGAEVQAHGALQSANAMEEMASGVQRIAQGTSVMAESAVRTSDESEKGKETVEKISYQMDNIHAKVNECTSVINRLDAKSQEIGEIVKLITEIASQTNLLALNAAIEAARAGEQGRGFAVVAQEVRKLAEQSAQSANEITDLIREVRDDTVLAVEAMNENAKEVETGIQVVADAGETFDLIYKAAQEVADQVQEISAVSEEIAAGTEEVSASMDESANIAKESTSLAQEVSASAQKQMASMEEITASAGDLSKMAQELQGLIGHFKI